MKSSRLSIRVSDHFKNALDTLISKDIQSDSISDVIVRSVRYFYDLFSFIDSVGTDDDNVEYYIVAENNNGEVGRAKIDMNRP